MIPRKLGRAVLAVGVLLAAGVSVAVLAPAASAASIRYEAESATISNGAVASNHTGYTGTGFVDFVNQVGSYVEFSVPATAAQNVTLSFRYANGTSTDRPMSLAVNGTVLAASLSFPGTGSWTTWQTKTASVGLTAGTDTIRVTATTANGGPNLDSLTVDDSGTPATDWSVAVVNSTMARFTPSTLGGWGYTEGLYLYGQYLVYQRTHDASLLAYIKSWADRFVGSDGSINNSFDNLDSMESGNILLILYSETGQAKYRTAATKIYNRLEGGGYPRTSDGGFWHGTSRQHQLWLDGTYMALPFLIRYGNTVGNKSTAFAEAVNQLLIYGGHLEAPNGLLYHAYDESGSQSWVVSGTKHSPEFWCRAIGWYGMATTTVLDAVPASQPNRGQLLTILQKLVAAMKTYQDPVSGRWFQVVDKGSHSDNWTETSCSAMYTYVISRSVQQGYVDPSYKSAADKGYQGVLAKVSLGGDGRTNITDISIGTNVGSYSYYVGRTRATNDLHGLGAFLIMNEQLSSTG
jgi:unsaturated rhamnogalacturonyl hydrolase